MDHSQYYAIIPYEILQKYPSELALYGLIQSRSRKLGYCYTSVLTFAEELSVSRQTIAKWLKSLQENGYIEIAGKSDNGTKHWKPVNFSLEACKENLTSDVNFQIGACKADLTSHVNFETIPCKPELTQIYNKYINKNIYKKYSGTEGERKNDKSVKNGIDWNAKALSRIGCK